jgi:hypothetical protein
MLIVTRKATLAELARSYGVGKSTIYILWSLAAK